MFRRQSNLSRQKFGEHCMAPNGRAPRGRQSSPANVREQSDLSLAVLREHGMVFKGLLFWNDLPTAGAGAKPAPTAAGQQ